MGPAERRTKEAAFQIQTKDAEAGIMKTKTSRTRRTFYHEWDEIDYLYMKILHWFYGEGNRRKAMPFCARLEALLEKTPDAHEAILGEECWSLICELRGDLAGAIAYREREIELIKRLHRISVNTPGRDIVLREYGYSDLSDRFDLLAILYHDAGNLSKAIQVLKESRRLCQRHGIAFDGEDLLRDYLAEAAANGQSRRHLSSGKN
jgi:tetratricopeptide (TPR) repeat protein